MMTNLIFRSTYTWSHWLHTAAWTGLIQLRFVPVAQIIWVVCLSYFVLSCRILSWFGKRVFPFCRQSLRYHKTSAKLCRTYACAGYRWHHGCMEFMTSDCVCVCVCAERIFTNHHIVNFVLLFVFWSPSIKLQSLLSFGSWGGMPSLPVKKAMVCDTRNWDDSKCEENPTFLLGTACQS